MALSAVLERTTRLRADEEEQIARAAEEHNRRSTESYKMLVSESFAAASAPVTEAPVKEAPVEEKAPEAEAFAPVAEPEVVEETPVVSGYAQAAADYRAVEMPAGRKQLFDGIEYKNGELVREVAAPEIQDGITITPSKEDEDALPTRRTLETLARPAALVTAEPEAKAEEHVGFLAALSTRTKVALVAVALTIVVLFVLVIVNTVFLGGLDASIAAKQAELSSLTETSQSLHDQIGSVTDPSFVDDWAVKMGMQRP